MDELGVAEPVLTAMLPRGAGAAWAGRATCRLWRKVLDPHFGAWLARVLQMASFPQCASCLSLYGPPTERRAGEPMPYHVHPPRWVDGNTLRHRLFAAAAREPAVARGLARLLASTDRATTVEAAVEATCPECARSGPQRRLAPRPPRADKTWRSAADVVDADLMRALRLHVPLPTDRVDRVLNRASAAGNDLLVEWLVELPTVGTDWPEVARAIEFVASPAVARALGRRLDLRSEFHKPYCRVRDPCRAALKRAAHRGDWDVCIALVDQVGYRPDDVGDIFRGLVEARKLDAAQWLHDRVGVDRHAFLHHFVLDGLAAAGDVATIRSVVRMLALTAADVTRQIWYAAARTGQTSVIEWLMAEFPLDSAETHQMLAVMIGFRHDAAVDWLTSRCRLDWRPLGREVLARATRELELVTVVRLYERLGVTSAALLE